MSKGNCEKISILATSTCVSSYFLESQLAIINYIMSPIQFLDDLVREYLLFRGFVNTLKIFDADVKAEKEKGLRSDK